MAVKLNHYWSIIPGKYDEYETFVIQEFVPGVKQLGLNIVAAWSVMIGAYSDIVFENAGDDLELIEKALNDKQYKVLKQNLLKYVKKYQTKVLANTGRIDSYSMDIQQGTIKFNQMWDVQSGRKNEYEKFVIDEYFPVLKDLGILVAGEWEVLIGDGPGIICEGRVTDINNLLINLQSKKFQNAKKGLKQLVEDYRSRILISHIDKSYLS